MPESFALGKTKQDLSLIAIRKIALTQLLENHQLDVELEAFIKSILGGCPAQDAYLEMDSYSRKRITKILRKDALKLNGEEQNWQDWITQQQNTLKTQFMCA